MNIMSSTADELGTVLGSLPMSSCTPLDNPAKKAVLALLILEMGHPDMWGLPIFVLCLLTSKQQSWDGNPEIPVPEMELFATMPCSEIPP